MSILNQSISPNGQSAFPLKGSTPQDQTQHVQMRLPLHGTPSKACQMSSTKKQPSRSIASRVSVQEQSLFSVSGAAVTRIDEDNDSFDESTTSLCSLSNLVKHEKQPEDREKCKISVCGVKFQPFTPSFLHAFLQNDKFSMIEDANREAGKNPFQPSDVLVVSVSSAVKLDDQQIDLITRKMQRLTGFRKLRLENTIDPSLIAGFVINYCDDGSHVIDLSVKGQLATLAERIESSDQQKSASNVHSWSVPHNMS